HDQPDGAPAAGSRLPANSSADRRTAPVGTCALRVAGARQTSHRTQATMEGTMKVTLGAVTVVVLVLLTVPLTARAQPPGKVWRKGVLGGRQAVASAESPGGASFRQGLHAFGYEEGQNIVIEWRSSGGQVERLPDLAAELVRLKVDGIVATDNPAIAAAQRAT